MENQFHNYGWSSYTISRHNNTLVRTQTTLRFVCAAQLGRSQLHLKNHLLMLKVSTLI